MTKPTRILVTASYVATRNGAPENGQISFIARVTNPDQECRFVERAKNAVARRLKIARSAIVITGIIS